MRENSLRRHIEDCNRFDPSQFQAFAIAGHAIGRVRDAAARHLVDLGLAQALPAGVGIPGGGFLSVSRRLADIVAALARAGLMAAPRGEMCPVLRAWGTAPVAEIDRAGLPGLGLPAFGVHVNGFVRQGDGLHLWVGRRARDREVAPGKLDHLVAGGVPMGLTADETLVKEAGEEAGLPAEIARRAIPAGLVSYCLELPEGLRNDTLFVYDLELPSGVVPANCDGEVERFELWPLARIIETLRGTEDFKFNVNLVVIDFLIRHGVLRPDVEPDYAQIVKSLRR
jgi:8-oxo-dGTP pyrophosphatase MutT (NUDIX family)